jgi:hypothetical protein
MPGSTASLPESGRVLSCRRSVTNRTQLLFRIRVVYRWHHCITHANISYSMISLVIKFVVPCKLRAPDAKTWVVVIEFFNEWTLISRSHHTSQVLVSVVKTLNKLVGMHYLLCCLVKVAHAYPERSRYAIIQLFRPGKSFRYFYKYLSGLVKPPPLRSGFCTKAYSV